jgi:hypothetical protein
MDFKQTTYHPRRQNSLRKIISRNTYKMLMEKLKFVLVVTEQVGSEVTLRTCIQEVLGSNFGHTLALLTEVLYGVPQSCWKIRG